MASVQQRAKRGDVVAWAEQNTYTFTTGDARGNQVVTTYYVGLVESVTRDGIAKTAKTGMGTSPVVHTIESAVVEKARIDQDRAWAWLTSDANWPRAGSAPLRSIDDVRTVVRGWMREQTA